MRSTSRALLFAVFTMTGFSALTLQVVWQRVISLHAGVDLVSFTTVVAAFLAGIGVGSLLGGILADRLGARGSVRAFGASNLAIGVFSWLSLWLFYDVYEQQAASLTNPLTKFAFNIVLLLFPTTLMGLSLPLVAKGVVARVADAGPLVGRLYSANTLGAAAGAAVAGWFVLGSFGFTTAVRLAGTLNLLAALLVFVVARTTGASAVVPTGDAVVADEPDAGRVDAAAATVAAEPAAGEGGVWFWYVAYALTGAVALGFELAFFRLIDASVRSNSYSFAHVLSIYLLLFGLGAAVASRLVRRAVHPGRWFLWIEFGVGLAALAGVIVLTRVVPRSPLAAGANDYFGTEGFITGFTEASGGLRGELVPVFVGLPLLVMGLPVLGMGAAFPFVQALVSERMSTLGRHTGRLVFANVCGNVVGTLLVGFVVIDRLGTAGTFRLLALALLVPGVAAALRASPVAARRIGAVVAVTLVMVGAVAVFPSNERLYAQLHGVTTDRLHLAEDRSCANALRQQPDGSEEMTVNGSPQNGYPFDQFHLVLGLTPSLLHDDPEEVMALGLGIGATPYGVTLDERVDAVRTVEICGPQIPLLRDLGERRAPELRRLFADPRVELRVGDGRDYLLRTDTSFDVIVVDTLRPQSAFSGNLYSVEFYELVAERLSDDGLLAQWIPSNRALNSVLEVFPHVTLFRIPSYGNSLFFVAGKQPVPFDRDEVRRRVAAISPDTGLTPDSRNLVDSFFADTTPLCALDASTLPPSGGEATVNRDLQPRDEYFLNQRADPPARATCPTPGRTG